MLLNFKEEDPEPFSDESKKELIEIPFIPDIDMQIKFDFFESLKPLFAIYEESAIAIPNLTYDGQECNSPAIINSIFAFFEPLLERKQNPTFNDFEIILRVLEFMYKQYKNKFESFLQRKQLFTALQLILFHSSTLPIEFITQFDINPLIHILNIAYTAESCENWAPEMFPVELIMKTLFPLVQNNINLFGHEWLIFLINLFNIFKTPENAVCIFQEATKLRNSEMDEKRINNLLILISSMIEHEVLPIELYKEYDYSQFLLGALRSNNPKLLPLSLLILGKTIRLGIAPLSELDWRNFADILFEHLDNDKIVIHSLWVITQFMTPDDCDEIIQSRFFNKLIGLECIFSINSKLEIWYFIFDVIHLTTSSSEKYISYKIYDIIIDLLQLENLPAIERILPIFCDILEDANQHSLMTSLQYLLENNFEELLNEVEDECSEDFSSTLMNFRGMINWFNEESEKQYQ